jgi:23S rRNA 5-hydroxycytidine C2501 synthase
MSGFELELLSPARDADIGIEAIRHGADAIYIGGPSFGARDKVPNSVADIARLVREAHRFHARIFVTLNTILRDDELELARRLVHQLYDAGVDALIVQDMGLLELDLPPIQLHASTQTDIRTPEKARFLQDVGFSQMVLARELTLSQIRDIARQVDRAKLEFFVHGALCVAYSGQCFISHAVTGRSANRGSCSQECRQPYTVTDAQGRIVAHDKHVLSLKDNDQSANLAALIDAGIRSFKIEGRYKDMGYVKNVTAHYRQLLDGFLEARAGGPQPWQRSSSGQTKHFFTPDPDRNFNRGTTDYFVQGRQIDIGAFDSPKHAGLPVGHVSRVGVDHVEVILNDPSLSLNNGDSLTWWDLQGELQGCPVNVARALQGSRWRVEFKNPPPELKDLRRDTALSRNRDMAWDRLLSKPSAERLVALDLFWAATPEGFELQGVDEDGCHARVSAAHPHQAATHPERNPGQIESQLQRLGGTLFQARSVQIDPGTAALFVPSSVINGLRRQLVETLEAQRLKGLTRLPRAQETQPAPAYPDDALTYLANVYNHQAAAFYARHGVRLIESAYESHEVLGEASLMITKHCVRWSLSLCPKQAKGVVGVQGTVKAEPLTLTHGQDRLTLRFDCKPCEMHVVGKMHKHVLKELAAQPMTFYRQRPATVQRQGA